MNLIKPNKFLLFIVNPALLLIGALLFSYYPSHIISAFHVFWILVPCVFLLFFPRKGRKRLAVSNALNKKLSWQPWLCTIIVFELLIIGSYFGIALLCGELLPINTTTHLDLFHTSIEMLAMHLGLFPWTLYAILAASIGFIAYHQEKDAYLSELLKPLLKSTVQSPLGLIANIGFRRCVLFSLSITLAMTALLLTNFLLPVSIHLAYGFNTHAIIVSFILIVLSFTDKAKHLMLRLFSHTIHTYFSLPLFCFVLGLLCIALTLATTGFYHLPTTTPQSALATAWIHYPWENAWAIFTVLWFLCLTPLVTVFIARISKGYRVREVIAGVLALPIFILLFSQAFKNVAWSFSFSPIVITIISVISLLLFLPIVMNHGELSTLIFAYLPKNGISKHRDRQDFIVTLLRMTVTMLFLLLTIGLNGITFFLFAANFLTIVTLPLAAISMVLPS